MGGEGRINMNNKEGTTVNKARSINLPLNLDLTHFLRYKVKFQKLKQKTRNINVVSQFSLVRRVKLDDQVTGV